MIDKFRDAIASIGSEASLGYLEALTELEEQEIGKKAAVAMARIKAETQLNAAGKTIENAFNSGKEILSAYGRAIGRKLAEANGRGK